MFKLGNRVRITQIIDPEMGFSKETTDCVGETGEVVGISTENCGASAEDPFYSVLFANGHKDSFWTEEMEHETAPPKYRWCL